MACLEVITLQLKKKSKDWNKDVEQTVLDCIPVLLQWYDTHKRNLPWRQTNDAYSIWISEIMLQQTRVEAVIDYYNRFLKEVPNIQTLASISEDHLLKLWQGLGYYSRARNLQKTAKLLIEQGQNTLPHTYNELVKLPGIGTYTAGAIASIAYQESVPAVDGNVLRILTRILGTYDDITSLKTKTKYEKLLNPYMPKQQSGSLNQAMMELGATICIPNGLARCNICPVSSYCQAYQQGLISILPIKSKKIVKKKIQKTVFVYTYQGSYAIQRRPSKGLLASLYEFPNIDSSMDLQQVLTYLKMHTIFYKHITELGNYTHVFTHLEWEMVGYLIDLDQVIEDYLWVTKEELEANYSLPTAFYQFWKQI